MKKNRIVLIITLIIMSVIGITYAIYTWAVELDIDGSGKCFDVVYVKGRDIGSNENRKTLMLGYDYRDGLSTTVEVKLTDICEIDKGSATLYLNTDSSTSSYLINSGALKYQVIDGNTLGESGSITSTGKLKLMDNINVSKNDKGLIVYVWIDGELVNNDNYEEILNSTYTGSISLEVESR